MLSYALLSISLHFSISPPCHLILTYPWQQLSARRAASMAHVPLLIYAVASLDSQVSIAQLSVAILKTKSTKLTLWPTLMIGLISRTISGLSNRKLTFLFSFEAWDPRLSPGSNFRFWRVSRREEESQRNLHQSFGRNSRPSFQRERRFWRRIESGKIPLFFGSLNPSFASFSPSLPRHWLWLRFRINFVRSWRTPRIWQKKLLPKVRRLWIQCWKFKRRKKGEVVGMELARLPLRIVLPVLRIVGSATKLFNSIP